MLLNGDWVFYSSVSQLFLPPKIWWEKYSFQCTKKSWVNCIRNNINYKNGGGDGRVWHLLLLEIRTYLHCCFGFAFEIYLNTPLNDTSLSLSLSLSWVIWGKTVRQVGEEDVGTSMWRLSGWGLQRLDVSHRFFSMDLESIELVEIHYSLM
jgi:hypothetical protein